MLKNITIAERVQAAKEKTDRIVDHLLYLIALHESNAVIVYSDALSKQMPRSYAAHAFSVFRQCMSHFEIVRLCALWDSPSANQKGIPTEETIPTLVKLINDPNVVNVLAREARANSLVGVNDPALADISQMLKKQAKQSADKARRRFKKFIKTAHKIEHSALLDSIRNLRHKHLAHSLSETRREQKSAEQKAPPVLPLKYGDERKLLVDSPRSLRSFIRG